MRGVKGLLALKSRRSGSAAGILLLCWCCPQGRFDPGRVLRRPKSPPGGSYMGGYTSGSPPSGPNYYTTIPTSVVGPLFGWRLRHRFPALDSNDLPSPEAAAAVSPSASKRRGCFWSLTVASSTVKQIRPTRFSSPTRAPGRHCGSTHRSRRSSSRAQSQSTSLMSI